MSRIAIVDDSRVARMHIAHALGDGVEVVPFESAMGFVAALREGLDVDGVVTDLWIDGEENWTGALVVRACYRLPEPIPVVVATAQESGRDAIAKSLGCPVLQKPADGAQLRAALGL